MAHGSNPIFLLWTAGRSGSIPAGFKRCERRVFNLWTLCRGLAAIELLAG